MSNDRPTRLIGQPLVYTAYGFDSVWGLFPLNSTEYFLQRLLLIVFFNMGIFAPAQLTAFVAIVFYNIGFEYSQTCLKG